MLKINAWVVQKLVYWIFITYICITEGSGLLLGIWLFLKEMVMQNSEQTKAVGCRKQRHYLCWVTGGVCNGPKEIDPAWDLQRDLEEMGKHWGSIAALVQHCHVFWQALGYCKLKLPNSAENVAVVKQQSEISLPTSAFFSLPDPYWWRYLKLWHGAGVGWVAKLGFWVVELNCFIFFCAIKCSFL